MKTRITLFLALLALCVFGQTFQRSLPFLAKVTPTVSPGVVDPSGSTNLALWFHASDLTNDGPAAAWKDRIQNWYAVQPTAIYQPNYTNGVGAIFTKTNYFNLTNGFTFGSTNACAVILSTKEYINPQWVLNGDTGSGNTYLWIFDSWREAGGALSPNGSPAVNKLWLILLDGVGANTYTNNIASGVFAIPAGLMNLTNIGVLGGTKPQYPFHGTLEDIFIWTNAVPLLPTHRTNLWYWATNTYPSIIP